MGTTLLRGGRPIVVLGPPRKVDGGYVVLVAWATDDTTQILRDGSVHPAHRAGFSWEEPEENLRPAPSLDACGLRVLGTEDRCGLPAGHGGHPQDGGCQGGK